jgi:molybdopterin/thiamine biosynthesis adenylyltransferase
MKQTYRERFMRSMGIIDESHLEKIKETSIAIGGLGLGGSIFMNLVRMGFEKFHIADPDTFERTNINRQRLAKETTIGRRKDECVAEEARAINPDVQIKIFPTGVKPENVDKFLEGIDWVVDVVDVFAMPDKLALHAEARKRKIPVASCATLGFTGTVIIFNEKTPSFAELTGMDPKDHFIPNLEKFLQFICPDIPPYMHDQLMKSVDRSTHLPFITPGGEISAAFCVTEITKNIVGFGQRIYAPKGVFADAFHHKVEIFNADYKARRFNYPKYKKAA